VREIQYHRHPGSPDVTDTRITRNVVDTRGNLTHSTDPRLYDLMQADSTVSPNFVYLTALIGDVLRTGSADAGTTISLNDAAGRPALAVSATGMVRTWQYEVPPCPGAPSASLNRLRVG
jgi:insecticidal toxin complex protein TccC